MTETQGLALQTANPSDRVALRGVRLVARVAGLSCKATLEQTFVNLEPRAIEAVYTFPLPDGAAVCGFEVVFFDKVFTGVVDESDRAIERYDDAIADGHGAYLLEQHRPDVFTVRVGNLKPRQAVTIRLTYVTDVQTVDRQVRLSFPTTIAPRYQTASGTDPIDAAIDGDALNPPHVLSVPYGLTMELELDLGKGLIDVQSPSHAIRTERAGAAASAPWRVTFAGGLAEMNRDVVLSLALAKEQEPFALAATSPDGGQFVALNFLPEFDEGDAPAGTTHAETVFVLDCSGSMQGESMDQARAALACCLRAMSAGDTFNVCRFGSTCELLNPDPLAYSQHTLNRALAFVRQGANLGGTELLAPLQAVLAEPPAVGRVRNVVLLTDGQVSNEPAIVALAKRHRGRNRIFTFGIGAAASAFLVNGLARVTGGAAEFIAPGERIEEKVLRTFGRLASPPVTDVEIDWGNADADAVPRALPPLFDGDALRVFARVPGRLPDVVTLKCDTATGPRSWSVRVRHADDPANVLPTLWARAAIRHLEEEEGVQASATISGRAGGREGARLIELSKRYNLLCGLTSFVAVEHRSLEDRNTGQPATRRIPTHLALGWGGVECLEELAAGSASGPVLAASFAAPAPPTPPPAQASRARRSLSSAPAAGGPGGGLFKKVKDALGGGSFGSYGRSRPRDAAFSIGAPPPENASMDAEAPTPADPDDGTISAAPATYDRADIPPFSVCVQAYRRGGGDDGDPLIDLLGHQLADGSFDEALPISRTLRAANLDRLAIEAAIDHLLSSTPVPPSLRPKARLTLLVLLVLRLSFADRQATWSRAAKKAVRYLTDTGHLQPGQADEWLRDLATRFAPPQPA